jgi:diaminopimelate decarboxylase/aspartate kinase
MKFGGTSVSTPERWEVITKEMKKVRAAGMRPFVAISALGSVTNRLGKSVDEALEDIAPGSEGSAYKWVYDAHMELAEKVGVKGEPGMATLTDLLSELERLLNGVRLTREVSPKLRARVSSFGELMSTALGVMVINKAGVPCVRLDARKLLKSTESLSQADEDRYMQAIVNPASDPELVASEMQSMGADMGMDPTKASAVLVQGFIGSTPKGDTCLLGRGGSDTSGALFAALVGASRYEIWTDVHGLFTSDPRFVEGTRLIKSTNYRTAQELATLGAKVLHERCLVPAAWAGIPVEVHNTADPDGPSTRIEAVPEVKKEGTRILGVIQRKGQVLLNVKSSNSLWGEAGFFASVMETFGELGVNVDLVALSQYTVDVALDYIPGGVGGDVFSRLYDKLTSLGSVTMKENMAVVSVVGENLRDALPELGTAMGSIGKHPVYLISQSSEDLSLSFVVDEEAAPAVVQGIHNVLLCGTAETGSCPVDESVFGQSWDELKTEFLKVEAR